MNSRLFRLDHLVAAIRGTKRYGIFWPDRAGHSGLILAVRMTLAHFSVSSAMSFPKLAGVIVMGTLPRSASRAFIPGSVRAALISLLSLSTISVGVFLGAPRPVSKVAS